MSEHQKLGGTRQSSPLEDEMSYPLTYDEFMIVKDNLTNSKFGNLESFLLSTLITSIISIVVILFSGSIYTTETINDKVITKINLFQIITLIIYGAIIFGSLTFLLHSWITRKKNLSTIERLEAKIKKHLEKAAE
jgi:hypothetical protein